MNPLASKKGIFALIALIFALLLSQYIFPESKTPSSTDDHIGNGSNSDDRQ